MAKQQLVQAKTPEQTKETESAQPAKQTEAGVKQKTTVTGEAKATFTQPTALKIGSSTIDLSELSLDLTIERENIIEQYGGQSAIDSGSVKNNSAYIAAAKDFNSKLNDAKTQAREYQNQINKEIAELRKKMNSAPYADISTDSRGRLIDPATQEGTKEYYNERILFLQTDSAMKTGLIFKMKELPTSW